MFERHQGGERAVLVRLGFGSQPAPDELSEFKALVTDGMDTNPESALQMLAFGMGATFGGVSGVMFASFQGFVSPESFSLQESVLVVAMVVLGGIGHLPGVVVGALLLAALPEVLRHVVGPLQSMTDGRLDSSILRQLLIALAMIGIMLLRPRGLWPAPEHGESGRQPDVKEA